MHKPINAEFSNLHFLSHFGANSMDTLFRMLIGTTWVNIHCYWHLVTIFMYQLLVVLCGAEGKFRAIG